MEEELQILAQTNPNQGTQGREEVWFGSRHSLGWSKVRHSRG